MNFLCTPAEEFGRISEIVKIHKFDIYFCYVLEVFVTLNKLIKEFTIYIFENKYDSLNI